MHSQHYALFSADVVRSEKQDRWVGKETQGEPQEHPFTLLPSMQGITKVRDSNVGIIETHDGLSGGAE